MLSAHKYSEPEYLSRGWCVVTEPRLTTTAYAILGLLSVGDWSTYELAAQMKRSLQFFWPRAASRIYEEPKRLTSLGYAAAIREPVGRRPRTVYRITAAGRDALRRWVDETAADGRTYESEPLVRLFFGNVGTKEAMLRAIDQVAGTARAALRSWIDVAGPYAEGRGMFPERLHVNALVMRLVFEISVVELTWAEWARAEVERWPAASTPADRQALERLIGGLLDQIPPPVAGEDGGSAA
jgi:PadR family transcriptional regulator AphA